jgi:hypothetical protein
MLFYRRAARPPPGVSSAQGGSYANQRQAEIHFQPDQGATEEDTGRGTNPGGTVNYNLGIWNPDPTQAIWLFAHVWVGSGNVDPTPGTFLLNVDPRFPRLTEPAFDGLTIASNASATLSFALKVPNTVEKTNYLGNSCLIGVNWHDVGRYLDRGVFVFAVN